MSNRLDVAIVGYGPVGQTLAILLAQHGWKVGVFEKQPMAYPLPRAVHFDDEVARILQSLDVMEQIAPRVDVADVYEWRNDSDQTLLRFESSDYGVCGWPQANMFAQPDLERILDARARSLPSVEVHRGSEAIDLTQEDDGVTLKVVAQDGETHSIRARYLVGCDGANSFVRPFLGATVTDLGFFFDWLIVDVIPHELKIWKPLNIQICDPRRPTTLVSGGLGRRRWEFMCLPGESPDHLNQPDTAWELLKPWDVTPGNATLERHTVYRFQARWVDTWRRGRLLLAGDAAHQMPPFAGQGMCSGIRDAANLAWKLDRVLAGKSPDSLIDSYAEERIPHVRTLIDFSMALGRVICIADPAEAAARDAAMSAAAATGEQSVPPPRPAIGRGLSPANDPLGGHLSLQGRVQSESRTGRFDDVIGRGWTLLGHSADPKNFLDAESAAYFASLGGVTAQVGLASPIRDLDGSYDRWFRQANVDVILQRPDFHVFASAAKCSEAANLVHRLREAIE